MTQSDLIRFFKHVKKTETCWLWTGYITPSGYGRFYLNGKCVKAHRAIYEHHNGPIVEGNETDHLCRTRHCVRNEHLESVTKRENILRGANFSAINARKTSCPKGHSYSHETIYINKYGHRECRICKRSVKKLCSQKYRDRMKLTPPAAGGEKEAL